MSKEHEESCVWLKGQALQPTSAMLTTSAIRNDSKARTPQQSAHN